MNENIVKRNELLAQKVIKGLESRNMTGYYVPTAEEALKKALGLIPEGATVTMGGAMSAHEIGLVEALKNGKYDFVDRDKDVLLLANHGLVTSGKSVSDAFDKAEAVEKLAKITILSETLGPDNPLSAVEKAKLIEIYNNRRNN